MFLKAKLAHEVSSVTVHGADFFRCKQHTMHNLFKRKSKTNNPNS